jgi:hypothetical protein
MSRRIFLPLLACLLPGLLTLVLFTPGAAPADEPTAQAKAKVKQLVDLLDDADGARRDAAAKALLKMGPDILPLLSDPSRKLSPRQSEVVTDLVKKLRALQGEEGLAPKIVTLVGSCTLEKALAELSKQSGNPVEDRRNNKSEANFELDLNKVPFWQALDRIARESDTRLDLYQRDGVLALVDGPYREPAAGISYNGIFRTVARTIRSQLDLDSDMATYEVNLEITWEPRFRPFFIEPRPDSLEVLDDKKQLLAGAEQNGGRVPVDGRAASIDLRLPPIPRAARNLALLKGKLALLGPSKWLTFTFDDLKVSEQTKDGVGAKLSKVTLTPDLWSFEMTVKYPENGPSFESFESWLVYNEMHLARKSAPDQSFANNGGFETGNSSGTKASISYHYVDDPKTKFVRGKPEDWKLMYRTPGQFIEVPALFEFKNVKLP